MGFSLGAGAYLDEIKFHVRKAESVVLGAGRLSGDVLRVYLVEEKLSWSHEDLRTLLCTFWDPSVLLACPCIDMDPQLPRLLAGFLCPHLLLLSMLRKASFPSSLMWDEPDLRRVMATIRVAFALSDMPLEMVILLLVPLLCIWGN